MYSQYILAQVGLLIWHSSSSFSLPPTTYRGICYSQLLLHNLMYAVGIPILRFCSPFLLMGQIPSLELLPSNEILRFFLLYHSGFLVFDWR